MECPTFHYQFLSIIYEQMCVDFHWSDMIKYVDQSIFCQIYQLLILQITQYE